MDKQIYKDYRDKLINESSDNTGFISEESFLDNIIPELLTVKLIDTDNVNHVYFNDVFENSKLKINAFCINQSGERLQLFIIDEHALLKYNLSDKELFIGTKKYYQELFQQALSFAKKSINRHLEVNDSDNSSYLINQLGRVDFISQLGAIEIFLISSTIPVESKSADFKIKKHDFLDEEIKVNVTIEGNKEQKEILVVKQLISLDKIYDYAMSGNASEPVVVNFINELGIELELLKAAEEDKFQTYLSVFPADALVKLYSKYSTRLLERNVRSFLQFKGVNGGMQTTIANQPERFVAYNNGLTITATDSLIKEKGGKLILEELSDLQIVNGGQTTASLYFANKGYKKGKKNVRGLKIDTINVMAKINVVKKVSEEELSELVGKISLFSNSQTKVSNVDKRVSDPKISAIKSQSESVVTPSGDKWYFEKMNGEFRTMLLFKKWDKKQGDKVYPKEKRLTKTEVGKYYTAWGDQPWLVKKGGELVFGNFLNSISGDEKKKGIDIDRAFYEELIAKSILFRKLEILHGTRNKAIGQLRAAVVPYTLSTLFKMFGGGKSSFDLIKVWKEQDLSATLKVFCEDLMKKMYVLIDKYKTSTDVSENTKKIDLWEKIKKSVEFKEIITSTDAQKIILEYKRDKSKAKKYKNVDFSDLIKMSEFYAIGLNELKEILNVLKDDLGPSENRKIPQILAKLFQNKETPMDIGCEGVKIIGKMVDRATQKRYQFKFNSTESMKKPSLALDNIINEFNKCIESQLDIESEFKKHESIALHKKMKFTGVINTVGKKLKKGEVPNFSELFHISDYFSSHYS